MRVIPIALLSLLFASLAPVHAAVKTWIGGDGEWSTPTNWAPPGVPASTDSVVISIRTVGAPTNTVLSSLQLVGGWIGGDLTVSNLVWTSGGMGSGGAGSLPQRPSTLRGDYFPNNTSPTLDTNIPSNDPGKLMA